ncbi:folate-binding protein YgfZ [Terriglobus roseus DSM 18391]|uniref:Folate-binding protein YgfZ n=1 Tax=Terriglobus roseus (strain DSM 18391 / NRRL B-41598 / KBS 63) TaxID=926566 RepID=I3ZL71_TERRK|nr:folate-binding protein YgfZ [Terriglobus roseus]AFL89989.1 folate-binding protein YgfZ [Terriglobus roseus DSM 18391]
MTDSSLTTVRPTDQLAALRTGAGLAALSAGWIAVTGGDRVRWLNGMVTNSVQALTPGEGAYAFLLSVQGRIQGDATVWAEADRLLLQTAPAQIEPMIALLDRFIIMDDVELADLSAEKHGLLVAGPAAVEKLAAIGVAARASRLLKRQNIDWQGKPLVLITAHSPLVPRFELWADSATDISDLTAALQNAGATICDEAGLDLLRIAEGTPRFGTDIRDRDLPQETEQTRALHFNKGCYLGQEIVERIRSRGNVHRTFTTFALSGEIPAPGTALTADGKAVGELTSIAAEPIDGQRLALGFVRREAIDRGLPLTFEGGTAEPRTAAAAS